MPNIVPGVVWQPINIGPRARRIKGRGLCGHVAVSSSKNLAPSPTGSADWHFYLPKSGPAFQYIDLDLVCYATGAGNGTMAAFESEGGLGTEAQVNAEPWTENQLDWAARILRHMHDTEGVPLRVMASSASSERGFGTHRLGVPGYMVAGTEQWSSSRGKSCPGTAKHEQRFEIVRRAAAGVTDGGFLMALTDAQQQALYRWTVGGPGVENNFQWVVRTLSAQIAGTNAALAKLADAYAAGRDDLTAEELKQAVVEALEASVVNVDVNVSPALRTEV